MNIAVLSGLIFNKLRGEYITIRSSFSLVCPARQNYHGSMENNIGEQIFKFLIILLKKYNYVFIILVNNANMRI